jgi:hypothetical protein
MSSGRLQEGRLEAEGRDGFTASGVLSQAMADFGFGRNFFL